MLYKIKELLKDVNHLDDARDMETKECHSASEAESLVRDMDKKGFVLVARREVKDWGAELFFERKDKPKEED